MRSIRAGLTKLRGSKAQRVSAPISNACAAKRGQEASDAILVSYLDKLSEDDIFNLACFRNGKLGRNSKDTKLTDPLSKKLQVAELPKKQV